MVQPRKSCSTSTSSKNKLSRWQEEFVGVKSFRDHLDDTLRIACTGISAGKSRALAWWVIMQMVKCNGCRCIGLAQTHKALKRVLMRELQIVCNIKHIAYTYNKSEQEFELENGSILFGYSGENPGAMLGLSNIDILAMDEAAYLPEEAYQYASDRMRGGLYRPMTRMISSPQSMSAENWFSTVCKQHPDSVIHATALDNPFTSAEFKQNLKDRYVEGSNIYRQQVLGEIFDFDLASQIVMRSDFVKIKSIVQTPGKWLGADFAGLGADSNAVVVVDSSGVVDWASRTDLDTHQKADQIFTVHSQYKPRSCYGDSTGGYGQGAMDLLKDKQVTMSPVNFSQKAFDENLYPNARTEMYLELAREIRNGFWVPDEIKTELLAMQVAIDNRGRQSLLPKDLAKKYLGHSPDLADACALAVYAMHHGGNSSVSGYSAEQAAAVGARYLRCLGY